MALSKALIAAGLKAPVRPRIRDEIWVKLWGNLSFNPISALTHATLDVLCTDPGTRAVARGMMVEAQEIAEKLGVKFPIDVERRIDGGAAVGAHRTSMWQDLELGRPMEVDALVTLGARAWPPDGHQNPHYRYRARPDPVAREIGGAVLLTLNSWTAGRIAPAFGVREDTVRQWRSDFIKDGVAALRARKASGPPPPVKTQAALRVAVPLFKATAADRPELAHQTPASPRLDAFWRKRPEPEPQHALTILHCINSFLQ